MIWCFLHTLPQRLDRVILNLAKVSTVRRLMRTFADSGAAADAFVRELDMSRITLRLREKQEKKGDSDHDTTIAKLQGSTLETLQKCLVRLHLVWSFFRPY